MVFEPASSKVQIVEGDKALEFPPGIQFVLSHLTDSEAPLQVELQVNALFVVGSLSQMISKFSKSLVQIVNVPVPSL